MNTIKDFKTSSNPLSKLKKLEEDVSDLMLKIICKNMIISAQQLEIKKLKEKLEKYEDTNNF